MLLLEHNRPALGVIIQRRRSGWRISNCHSTLRASCQIKETDLVVLWTLNDCYLCMIQFTGMIFLLHNAPSSDETPYTSKYNHHRASCLAFPFLRPPNAVQLSISSFAAKTEGFSAFMRTCPPGRPRYPPARRSSGSAADGAGRCKRAAAYQS
jgi:hypothetical protein